ncbi:right-handed parallel beta-helix repeat-containing protein [Streptomyces crystallinus]|uniref:Periplasmic copper-binding protein NosD beta helix domain-containing protein n=1 Tax=Streptomyces crystallinus TaxID=68191 RepID=A0ABP3QCH5_9ACTN
MPSMDPGTASPRLSRRSLLDRAAFGTAGLAATGLASATVLGAQPASAATPSGTWKVYYVDSSAGTTEAPVQAALNAAKSAGGGHVVVGPGTWTIGAYLRIGADTRLTLTPGTTFRRTGTTQFMLMNGTWGDTAGGSGYSGPGNIVVEGGVWDVAGPQPADDDQGWMGISIWHATDVTIRDLRVVNVSNWHAVEFGAVRNGRVENCRFSGWTGTANRISWGTEAVQLDSARVGGTVIGAEDGTACSDIVVRDNYCGSGSTVGGVTYGAFPTLVGSHGFDARNSHERVQIVSNTVHGSRSFAIHPYATNQTVVADNTMDDCFGGIRATYANSGGAVAGFQDLVVTGNIIQGAGAKDRGIDVMGGSASSGTSASRVVISGNVVAGAVAAGIRAYYAPDALISGNTVSGSNDKGIHVDSSPGCAVTGNVVRNGPNGVTVASSANTLVNGNSLLGTTTPIAVSAADSPGCLITANLPV